MASAARQRGTSVAPGFVADADVTYRVRYDDFVEVFAGRLDPRRALVTGRLRPRGSMRALWVDSTIVRLIRPANGLLERRARLPM